MQPIIQYLTDTDWYKLTMAQVIFNQFPNARVQYSFINRGKTIFPKGFADALRDQIQQMSSLRLTDGEYEWLCKIRYMKPTFFEWFRHYQFDPSEVVVEAEPLRITITGPWYRTCFWEVPLMAAISELYFKMTQQKADEEWLERLEHKGQILQGAGIQWGGLWDSRRYSYHIQSIVNERFRHHSCYRGTSNPHFAFKYGLTPIGTFAHEGPMAMQACYGIRNCNQRWMDAWVREFDGDLGIALTDTVTTPYFLANMSLLHAKLFDGMRQDSGNPFEVGEWIVKFYY